MLLGENRVHETHYEILSVKEDASYEEIRNSYRSAILQSHPDKLNCSSDDEKFLKIQKAWGVLSDAELRVVYDNDLRSSRQDGITADEISIEDMSVEITGEDEAMEIFYQCRCGDYFSVDSTELETMGFELLRDGDDFVRVRRLGALVASVVLPCGSCSLKTRVCVDSDMKIPLQDDQLKKRAGKMLATTIFKQLIPPPPSRFFVVSFLAPLMGMGRTALKLRKATKQLVLAACCSLSLLNPPSSRGSTAITKQDNCSLSPHHEEAVDKSDSSSSTHHTSTQQILCAICLEPLSHCGEAVFTGQCSHSFHISCIASNVRHGNATCPVCRAHWTHLPRSSFPKLSERQQDDSVFRILDDSIATSRVHRRSLLRSARYDDDDPIHLPHSTTYPRLSLSLVPLTVSHNLVSYPSSYQHLHLHQDAYSPLQMCRTELDTSHNQSATLYSPSVRPQPEDCHCLYTSLGKRNAYLSVKLTDPQPIDLVLVASPSGPHFRFLKQAMILVTSSLRPVDRLAIVTYSCVAAGRVFALRRMASCGKRAALRVIDRLFYMDQTDPSQGIRKGIKVLKDRAYKNPRCSILHISSGPVRSYYPDNSVMQMGFMVHRFHVGFGAETWNGFVMHKFEELVEKVIGGVATDVQLRIGMEGKIVKVGELRGGEEKKVLIDLGVHVDVGLCYSYVEGDTDECIRRRGETTLSLIDDNEGIKTDECESAGGSNDDYMNTASVSRSISTETWDYHDPLMARRWAKRLHETLINL
ncbi:unnamed protein product [Thlaspi arvense]|uniref:RING-type domain-containing protein n=1 Tax=Thlaspi arvense TaxID=13288 RepID=A0AAU9RRZ8_THLAR|nr:unnamed protein product [Thlaspi arvense]